MHDTAEIAALLHIHEKASAHGDMLKNIADEALRKLRSINDERAQKAEPEPEADVPSDKEEVESEVDHDEGHDEEPTVQRRL